MKHNLEIKGTADFSQVSREVKNLTRTIEDSLSREGAKLFDSESIKFLRNEANNSLARMSQQLNKAVQEAADLDEKIKASTGEEEKQNELIRKRLELTKQIKTLRSDARTLEGAVAGGRLPGSFAGRGSAAESVRQVGGRAGAAVGQIATSLPRGVGQVAGVATSATSAALSGATVAAGVALGALTAIVGGTVVAFSRMSSAFEVFTQSVPKLLTGAAIGVGQAVGRERDTAISLGFGADETLQQKIDLSRAFGTRGSAEEQSNMLANTQMASRALGVDSSQITGMANQLRAVGGTQMAQTGVAQILSRAMAEGMDRSQATHFLSATAATISEINQNGLLANDAIVGAMAGLSRDRMSPEMAQRTLGSMQSAITGSTGEANAFFQMAMAQAGVGRGTLAGSQLGVAQGLFGVDVSQHRQIVRDPQMLADLEEMGLTNTGRTGTSSRAGAILDVLDRQFGTEGTLGLEGRTARSQFLGQMFGTEDIAQAQKIETILRDLTKGEPVTEDQRKFIENIGKDPEAKWRDDALAALNNIAGSVARTRAGEAFTKFDLGAASADAMNALTNSMMKLDQTILMGIEALRGDSGGTLSREQSLQTAIYGGNPLAVGEMSAADHREALISGRVQGGTLFGEGGIVGATKRLFSGASAEESVKSIEAMQPFDTPSPLAEHKDTGIITLKESIDNLINATIEGNEARKKLLDRTPPKTGPMPVKVDPRKHGGR